METSKISVIKDYDTLNDELKKQVKLVYPNGFSNAIIEFTNNKKKKVSAIKWETSDKIYLLRLSNKMLTRILEDEFDFFKAN
ncbi:MAG: hypothetical protein JXB49_19680 [Bacteroidales bacterium]|nr:hypothetical protein [Bacteroidales bacterium]